MKINKSFFNVDLDINLVKGIFCLYYVAFFVHYFTNITIIVSIFLFSLTAMFGMLYILKNVHERELLSFFLVILIIDSFAVVAVLYNGNHTIADPIKLITYHLIALLLFIRRDQMTVFRNISIFLYWILTVRTIIAYFLSNSDLDFYISERIGSNTVSILAIFFFSIDAIWRINSKKKVNYFYCVMTVIVSIFSRSTAGIFTTVILFILISLYTMKDVLRKYGILLFIFSLIIFVLILNMPIIQYLENITGHSGIATRILMWEAYFDLLKGSITNILFGANISNVYLLDYYKNLHNTFINWHYYYGLIPFACFIYIIIREGIDFIKEKNVIISSILFIVFLRGMTDETTYAYMIVWIYLFCESKYVIN